MYVQSFVVSINIILWRIASGGMCNCSHIAIFTKAADGCALCSMGTIIWSMRY